MALRILMLGWEFPPYLNGGLGVATAGLAQAMAQKVDLTLVIPRAHPDYQPQGFRLLGMHGQTLPALKESYVEQEVSYLREVRVNYVPIDLAGYERVERRYIPEEQEHWLRIERPVEKEREIRSAQIFHLPDLYGSDLLKKVLSFADIVAERMAHQSFDCIHAHDWMTFVAGMELKARTGKPLVLHVHSLEYDRGGPESRSGIFELEQHALKEADAVVPVSEYTAGILESIYGIAPDRIHPVSNGIAPFESYRRKKPFPESLVVFLGRMTSQKGPEYFFALAEKLLRDRHDLRFALAGQGEEVQSLIEKTAQAKLGHRIHFTGYLEQDRAKELLAMADVFVLPSVSEPFGLVALEAAQMKVPCIVSQQSGVREVLPHALTADYADTEALAALVTSLIEREDLRQKVIMGQLADLKEVSWDHAANQILLLYQRLAN
ncbi:MAG: glycosyltransferase [Bacteroidota bacterium]